MSLIEKKVAFCNYYMELGNATRAYKHAYDASNMKDETIKVEANRLFDCQFVKARIKELQTELQSKFLITRKKILDELSSIGFASMDDYYNSWVELKDFQSLADSKKAGIKSISTKVRKTFIEGKEIQEAEIKIEVHDKLSALEQICKIMGYNTPLEEEDLERDFNLLTTEELRQLHSLNEKLHGRLKLHSKSDINIFEKVTDDDIIRHLERRKKHTSQLTPEPITIEIVNQRRKFGTLTLP